MTGDPRDMRCGEAVEHLYTYLDEELTPEVRAAVRSHLEQCSDCFGQFEFERTFLRFLEARCRAQCAPADLRRRIFEGILLDQDPGPY